MSWRMYLLMCVCAGCSHLLHPCQWDSLSRMAASQILLQRWDRQLALLPGHLEETLWPSLQPQVILLLSPQRILQLCFSLLYAPAAFYVQKTALMLAYVLRALA